MAGIVAAAVREARLPPGEAPSPARRRTAAVAGAAALAVLIAAVVLGNKWWNVEAASYAAGIYTPSELHPSLHGDTLQLTMGSYDPVKKVWVPVSPGELLLDHDHLIHLYAIRWPELDAAFHLHPEPVAGTDTLTENLPPMPPGTYRLFGDIVHHTGFPETVTATLTIPPGLHPAPLGPEDAAASPPPVTSGELGATYRLPDGYTMVWDRPAVIHAGQGYSFRFHLLDPAGKPASDVVPYLGMAGHAAWVKTDGSVFAHTHPDGSAAMPAMMMAEQGSSSAAESIPDMPGMAAMPGMDSMAGTPATPAMNAKPATLPPTVEFPYGFPSPGRYRVFIQMKHGATVETGVFDADVQ